VAREPQRVRALPRLEAQGMMPMPTRLRAVDALERHSAITALHALPGPHVAESTG